MSIAYISEYRKFTFSLCQELSTEDLNSLKYLLRDLLTIREIEAANSPTDLFVFLEQRNELGTNNCHLLKDLLTQIKRQVLVRKLQDFERKQLGKRAIVANNQTATNGISRAVNMEDMLQDCVADGEQHLVVPANNNEYVQRGHKVMFRDVNAAIYEKLGILLNPASYKNWVYLAGKLDYTYAQVSNYKLCPMQSTQMLLENWATRADATVLKLYHALMETGREDAARELEPLLARSTSVYVETNEARQTLE